MHCFYHQMKEIENMLEDQDILFLGKFKFFFIFKVIVFGKFSWKIHKITNIKQLPSFLFKY